jgi:hypothetical protein
MALHLDTTALPGWAFGPPLLLVLVIIFASLREPISAAKVCLLALFAAILAGLFATYFIKDGTIAFRGGGLEASGALCVFLLVFWLVLRFAGGRIVPNAPNWSEPAAPPDSEKSRLADVVRRVFSLLRNTSVSRRTLARLRVLVVALFCSVSAVLASHSVIALRSGLTVTSVPPFDEAGGDRSHAFIAGEAMQADCRSLRVVVYALTKTAWYVQPDAGPAALTQLGPTSKWRTCSWSTWTHTGTHYAVLLVTNNYRPADVVQTIPVANGTVIASVVVEGTKPR